MFLKRNKVFRIMRNNSWFLFSPFLLLYLIISIAFAQNALVGDEGRYLAFAHNLLNGFYSPPAPEINLWNGPGYPLLISIILMLKLPLIAIRLINGILLYFSLIITFKTINDYSSKKQALFFTIFLGLYFPIFQMLPLILTESFSWFLISLVCFVFIKNFKQKSISFKYIMLSSVSITFLALTKVIFGYVIISMLVVSIFMYFLPKFHSVAKKSTIIFLLSFIFCMHYLIYTYNLTNKLFYWTNSGSMSLYTMSTPFENELGDWHNTSKLLSNPNHTAFIDSINQLEPLNKDEAFKAKAIENIKNHPQKYFTNWIANVGRLLFSYPYSNAEQSIKTYFTIIPNMFIVVFIVFAAAISMVRYKNFPKEILLLLFFVIIYLFGSSLVSAYRRMFYITMPFWILFISYVFTNVIKIKFKQD